MEYRMHTSNHAFILLAILPGADFIAPSEVQGTLGDRLFHECMDFVVEPFKIAARIGIMLSDPVGNQRWCFTPLATYIADTPEQRLISCAGGNASPLTMAYGDRLGDPFRHEPRTASKIMAQLGAIQSKVSPDNITCYIKEASSSHFNGVDLPFWRDWHMAEPSTFLNPETLHHLHKFFWDHDAKWCMNVLTRPEIDFRFSVLQPRIGFRQFKEGISKLKQVTGRVHRDLQRYMIPVIAGGAAPRGFVIALRALMDFRYLSQAHVVDENVCEGMHATLKEFHGHKAAILEAGARRGKKRSINHFNIPKLELFQSMESSIRSNGANIQWSADGTEHAHITEIKSPANSGNNQNYEEQICRYLDRLDKVRRFELATSIRSERESRLRGSHQPLDSAVTDDHDTDALPPSAGQGELSSMPSCNTEDVQELSVSTHTVINYFQEAAALVRGESPNAPKPFRTFSAGTSAFHLNRDASYKLMTVDAVAQTFGLPDLRFAIMHYVQKCVSGEQHIHSVGDRRPNFSALQLLPFKNVQVWTRVRIQTVSFFPPHPTLPPETLEAEPPSARHPSGKYDSVLVNVDPMHNWPQSGIAGEICLAYAGVNS